MFAFGLGIKFIPTDFLFSDLIGSMKDIHDQHSYRFFTFIICSIILVIILNTYVFKNYADQGIVMLVFMVLTILCAVGNGLHCDARGRQWQSTNYSKMIECFHCDKENWLSIDKGTPWCEWNNGKMECPNCGAQNDLTTVDGCKESLEAFK